MDFKREWKGYNRAQVDGYIAKLTESVSADSARQQERIFELKDKLEKAEKELAEYRAQSAMVTKAIETAVKKADEIEELSKLKYRQEMEQLKVFHDKWLSYYKKLLKKYPMDDELVGLGAFNRSMSEILKNGETAAPIEQFERETERLEGGKKRIGYINVNAPESELSDDEIMKEILPDLPEGETEFNPVERVREYLNNRTEKQDPRPVKKTKRPAGQKKPAAQPAEYADRSESGFSFEEALHPTENLEDIMRDLGLFND